MMVAKIRPVRVTRSGWCCARLMRRFFKAWAIAWFRNQFARSQKTTGSHLKAFQGRDCFMSFLYLPWALMTLFNVSKERTTGDYRNIFGEGVNSEKMRGLIFQERALCKCLKLCYERWLSIPSFPFLMPIRNWKEVNGTLWFVLTDRSVGLSQWWRGRKNSLQCICCWPSLLWSIQKANFVPNWCP